MFSFPVVTALLDLLWTFKTGEPKTSSSTHSYAVAAFVGLAKRFPRPGVPEIPVLGGKIALLRFVGLTPPSGGGGATFALLLLGERGVGGAIPGDEGPDWQEESLIEDNGDEGRLDDVRFLTGDFRGDWDDRGVGSCTCSGGIFPLLEVFRPTARLARTHLGDLVDRPFGLHVVFAMT